MGKVVYKKINNLDVTANHLVKVINEHLQKDESVTWLVSGGSTIAVAVRASQKLTTHNLNNLSVTMTDERFVPLGDKDSNWQQLQDAGFNLPEAKLYPILGNEQSTQTTAYYSVVLHKILDGVGYKIGLFGMGPDGHIAALFPNLAQTKENDEYAVYLEDSPKPPPLRMTMTPAAILKLDEAVLFAFGEEKKNMLENLQKDLSHSQQPAQILKRLPKLTVYNDLIGAEQ